jgi:hypothetical protein
VAGASQKRDASGKPPSPGAFGADLSPQAGRGKSRQALAQENRSAGGAISVTRSRSSGLLDKGASVIARGSRRAVQA